VFVFSSLCDSWGLTRNLNSTWISRDLVEKHELHNYNS